MNPQGISLERSRYLAGTAKSLKQQTRTATMTKRKDVSRAGNRRPTPQQVLKARAKLEKWGGVPTFNILMSRLERAVRKLDLVAAAIGNDGVRLSESAAGVGLVTTECAKELGALHVQLLDWQRAHRPALEAKP